MNKLNFREKITEFDQMLIQQGFECLTARQRKRIRRLVQKIRQELSK